jgi:glycosyltransferase involved in cell wall biosynthesis
MFRKSLRSFIGRLNKLDLVQFGLRGWLLPFRIKQLSGPVRIDGGPGEVVVISVMRNSEPWLKSFLDHHRSMGMRHFVILDNGSTDRTVEFLSKQQDVTLLRTYAPYHAYENTMKRYLAKRYCRNRWCLCLDADERFDFPRSAQMSLSKLIEYLNHKSFNAVVTQMLDMFSDRPIADAKIELNANLQTQYPFYDLSNIVKTPYTFGEISNPAIMTYHGGIRKTVFGTNNCLSKVSLFLMDGKIRPFVAWHHAQNARLADISCVLLHFPFVDSFYEKVTEAVKSGRYGYLTTDEYTSYFAGLQKLPELRLKLESARKLASVDELVDNGFLVESADYRKWPADREDSGARSRRPVRSR